MPRLSVEDQFKKLQKQKIAIEQLEKTILDKDTRKSLQRVVAVIEKAVAAAFAIASEGTAKKRGRPAGSGVTAKKGKRTSKLAGTKVPPKYRNPSDKSLTWTGRGRMPLWAAELYEAGTLDKALIKKR